MSISTIMVHLGDTSSADALLDLTAGIAERFDSAVFGIASSQLIMANADCGSYGVELGDLARNDQRVALEAHRVRFQTRFPERSHADDWRSSICGSPSAHVATQARSADLIITSAAHGGSLMDLSQELDVGDLVMRSGRPVLVVPKSTDNLALDCVVVAWSDTRESRRAIADALPLLQEAQRVVVVEIAEDKDLDAVRERLGQVLRWLQRNAITAETLALRSDGPNATMLLQIADQQCADLLVAGAYGHSRLREWALGGVTRDLLADSSRCYLLSH